MAHFYTGVSYVKKRAAPTRLNVGAVLRHDVPIKRLCPLALQSSYLVCELRG